MLSVQKWKYMLLTTVVSAVLVAPVYARNPFKPPVKRKDKSECKSILNRVFKKKSETKTDYKKQDFALLGVAGRKYIIKDKKTGNIFLRAEGEKFGNCVVTRGVLVCY